MPRNLIVTKKSRDDPLPDKPIAFEPLENLHLELLENKKKIKPGLPLIPPQSRRPPRPRIQRQSEPPSDDDEGDTGISTPDRTKKPKRKGKSRPHIVTPEDEDLIAELGEDEPEELLLDDEDEGDGEEGDGEADDEDDPYAGLTPEEREIKEREEYIWRFRILKKQYKTPSVEIPTFNEHSDLQMMKTTYDRTIRELYLDDAVESYRTYLVGGFIVMEFVCTQWVGVDMTGFTVQQTSMMYKYDRLLIELGEKSYSRWGMNLPVEIRLIGLILMQAGIFYLGKVVTSKYGGTIGDLFSGMTGQPVNPMQSAKIAQQPVGAGGGEQGPKKRKMRGPKFTPDDIKNMNHAPSGREDFE